MTRIDEDSFYDLKKEMQGVIEELKEQEYKDWQIEPALNDILDEINSNENLFTTYSKYGKTVLVDGTTGLVNVEPYLEISSHPSILYKLVLYLIENKDVKNICFSVKSYYEKSSEIKRMIDEKKFNKKLLDLKILLIWIRGYEDNIESFWESMKHLKNIN